MCASTPQRGPRTRSASTKSSAYSKGQKVRCERGRTTTTPSTSLTRSRTKLPRLGRSAVGQIRVSTRIRESAIDQPRATGGPIATPQRRRWSHERTDGEDEPDQDAG